MRELRERGRDWRRRVLCVPGGVVQRGGRVRGVRGSAAVHGGGGAAVSRRGGPRRRGVRRGRAGRRTPCCEQPRCCVRGGAVWGRRWVRRVPRVVRVVPERVGVHRLRRGGVALGGRRVRRAGGRDGADARGGCCVRRRLLRGRGRVRGVWGVVWGGVPCVQRAGVPVVPHGPRPRRGRLPGGGHVRGGQRDCVHGVCKWFGSLQCDGLHPRGRLRGVRGRAVRPLRGPARPPCGRDVRRAGGVRGRWGRDVPAVHGRGVCRR